MDKTLLKRLIIVHIPLIFLLVLIIFVPNSRPTVRGFGSFLVAIAIIELLFLIAILRQKKRAKIGTGPFDIIFLIWCILIAWELFTSVLNLAHPVIVPSPENVFDTFREQWNILLLNVGYSMELLLIGFIIGMCLGIFLGLIAAKFKRFRDLASPISNVLAPIPAIVISPYLVAIMPTFRSASVVVIILGIVFPTFLKTVNQATKMDQNMTDTILMLKPGPFTVMFKIMLPYIMPGIISGLKISMTTSMLMLNFAELMGANHGMGYYVQNSIAYANYTHCIAGIIVIGIVVTIINMIISVIQKKAVRWS